MHIIFIRCVSMQFPQKNYDDVIVGISCGSTNGIDKLFTSSHGLYLTAVKFIFLLLFDIIK